MFPAKSLTYANEKQTKYRSLQMNWQIVVSLTRMSTGQ